MVAMCEIWLDRAVLGICFMLVRLDYCVFLQLLWAKLCSSLCLVYFLFNFS